MEWLEPICRSVSIHGLFLPQRGILSLGAARNAGRLGERAMVRLVKRYGSRKLYDTEESRYVGLDEIAAWIRGGQEVRVQDNKTAEDVTAATLAQIISEEGRRGGSTLTSDLMHQIIRLGEQAVTSGMEQIQSKIDRLVQTSVERLKPIRRAREEMSELRSRLDDLEAALGALEANPTGVAGSGPSAPRPRRAARRGTPSSVKTVKTAKKGVPS